MARLQWLGRTELTAIGTFSCSADEAVWSEEHEVTMDPLLAFPLSTWREDGPSGRSVVATPAEASVTVPGWRYRRSAIAGTTRYFRARHAA